MTGLKALGVGLVKMQEFDSDVGFSISDLKAKVGMSNAEGK